MTLNVTFLISVSSDARAMIFFLFCMFLGSQMSNKYIGIGKVTLKITWPWRTRSRLIVTVWNYIYLTSATLKTCKTKKDHRSSVTRIRDKKGHAQGHVTLTYKVTLDSYSVELYLSDIRDPKNLQNKKKDHRSSVTRTRDRKGHAQGHVTLTYKVTLDSYSVELYLFDIRDPKNLQNKKKIIALASLEPEIKRSRQGHVTVTYIITLEGYSVYLRSIDSYKQNYIQNSTKIISLAHLEPEIWTVMWKQLWKSAWPWIWRSRFNDNSSKVWFLKAAAFST